MENERALLPLRAICNMLGASVHYIQERREVQFAAGQSKFTMQLNSTEVFRDGEKAEALSVPPYAWQGHVYLPLRYMADLFGAEIVRNQELGRVEIYTEFEYEKIGTYEGGGTMGHATIWQVSPSGNRKEIFSSWQIAEHVIYDGYCYAFTVLRLYHGQIYKISLLEPGQQIMLGSSDFSYGFRLYDNGEVAYSTGSDMQPLDITAEGIRITGFLADGELGLIMKNDAVDQSYGVYLVDLQGNGHQLIEKLEPTPR